MCGYDELDIRKIAGEMFTNLALPAGVKVKVDCIDDRNRRLKKGIWAIWECSSNLSAISIVQATIV